MDLICLHDTRVRLTWAMDPQRRYATGKSKWNAAHRVKLLETYGVTLADHGRPEFGFDVLPGLAWVIIVTKRHLKPRAAALRKGWQTRMPKPATWTFRLIDFKGAYNRTVAAR